MVYVNSSFLNSKHGALGCSNCHNGNPEAAGKEDAHAGIIAAPSNTHNQEICGTCHYSISNVHASSLHRTMKGYYRRIENRLGYDISSDPEKVEHFEKECGKCHASCGQCHVSRPASVAGGFISGHNFQASPNMRENCTACHGSRVGAEYLGENEGIKADVHWIPNVKRCDFCHTGDAMHASSPGAEYRYEDKDMVTCEQCHGAKSASNPYHKTHWDDLSCQVCHSQPYKNCNSCHTGGAGITGSSYMSFKIAKNPLPGSRRYKAVTVRHIPISRDTYASWGIPDLPLYNSEPTWKYTTPHNIQRWTAQTDTTGGKTCAEKCHNDNSLYLTLSDLAAEEVEANRHLLLK